MMEITAEIRALIDKAAASMELAGDEYIVATEGVGIYGETLEDYLCRMETLGELMAVLDTCTEAQRRRFLLYALDGLTFSEIAALCGCSKSSVQGSIEAVRKIFKKILRNHPYE